MIIDLLLKLMKMMNKLHKSTMTKTKEKKTKKATQSKQRMNQNNKSYLKKEKTCKTKEIMVNWRQKACTSFIVCFCSLVVFLSFYLSQRVVIQLIITKSLVKKWVWYAAVVVMEVGAIEINMMMIKTDNYIHKAKFIRINNNEFLLNISLNNFYYCNK